MPNRRVHLLHWNSEEAGVLAERLGAAGFTLAVAAGLVDYKVCSIDSTWSGLRFTRRRENG